MSRRALAWFLVLALVLGAILLVRGCMRGAVDDADDARPDAPNPPATAQAQRAQADAAAAAELRRQRDYAMYEAVSALQAYLAAVGAQDWAKADPYWSGDRPDGGEADLRGLDKLRALRIENGNPKPLDDAPIPAALEIPVELRAGIEGEGQRRYRGRYRMRRAVDGAWEITSASVDAVPR